MSTTTSSHRPFNLPPELPDPPAPPAGHRAVYRGMGWQSVKVCAYAAHHKHIGWSCWNTNSAGDPVNHYVEYIPMRPVPEGVPPVPEGFEYWGHGGEKGIKYPYKGDDLSFDIIVLRNGKWNETGWVNCFNMHCALRIGSELHHRNFDAEEATAPQPEFRFFKDEGGLRWKVPTNGECGYIMRNGEWDTCSINISGIEREWDNDGTIETDADGNPLTVAEIPVTEQPAKAREWEINGCFGSAISALRFLAKNERPLGGKSQFNAIHLEEIANQVEASLKNTPGEADMLAQVTKQRDEAVGHLRILKDTTELDFADRFREAQAWLSTNFPQPEPEPDENGWLPIRYAIKDGRQYLLGCYDDVFTGHWKETAPHPGGGPNFKDVWVDGHSGYPISDVTHFQPLPKSPTPATPVSHE